MIAVVHENKRRNVKDRVELSISPGRREQARRYNGVVRKVGKKDISLS